MPKPPLPQPLDEFLAKPNPAVIATLQPGGAPHDGRVEVNMAATRKRLDYLRHDPRVSLTVLSEDDWYRHVTLRGRVTSLEDDPDLEGIDRLSTHYSSKPYANRDQQRVHAYIEVDWWHAWVHGHAWRPEDG